LNRALSGARKAPSLGISAMAKRKEPPPVQFIDLNGPKEPRSILSINDAWTEFSLSDGNTLRIKPVLADVQRLTKQDTPDGKPAYALQLGFVTETVVPKKTKAPKRKAKAKKSRKRR